MVTSSSSRSVNSEKVTDGAGEASTNRAMRELYSRLEKAGTEDPLPTGVFASTPAKHKRGHDVSLNYRLTNIHMLPDSQQELHRDI